MTKTTEEIEELKRQWLFDGVWDIEDTEGFEDHKDELLGWRIKIEREAMARVTKSLDAEAARLGIPDKKLLLLYILGLEERIKNIEAKLVKP